MSPPPTSIDGTDITGATIDGQEVQEITVDGQTVFEAVNIPDEQDLHAHYNFREYSGTSNFTDLTGNGFDLVNGSITGVTETINGVQAGEFDGVDDTVFTNTFANIPQPVTVFLVCRLDARDTTIHRVTQLSTNGMHFGFDGRNDFDEWTVFIGGEGSRPQGSSDKTVKLLTVLYDDSNSIIRENGVLTGFGGFSGPDMDAVGLGSGNPAFDGQFWDGAIGEVLVYPSDKSAIFSEAESYLASEWGISI